MKFIAKVLGALFALLLLALVVQLVASETGEVVVASTRGADGAAEETRLWIVDLDGQPYLRAGSSQAQWYGRLVAHPEITVERHGTAATFVAVPSPSDTATVNALMAEKYGWADAYIGMIFSRDGAVAIRLDRKAG